LPQGLIDLFRVPATRQSLFFLSALWRVIFFIMTKQEKIALQQENTTNALEFKEGFFYKVYNQGAWLLKEKQYKVKSNGKGNLKCLYI
jgi:hypothetical protein